MSTEILNLKRNHKNSIKYFIFSLFVFVMIFAFHLGGESVSAVESFSYTIHQSNHNGEKLDGTASSNNAETRSAGYKSNWYVQGTGVIKKDVISLTLQIPYMNINGISVIETGYTDSSGSGYYDSYKKIDGEWINQTDSGLPKGSVLSSTDALCTTNFDTAAARDSRLVANGAAAASGVYSLMCISEVQNTVAGSTDPGTITIQYVYTIRNGGYGEKEIVFTLYNDFAYNDDEGANDDDVVDTPIVAKQYTVELVVSKPINESEFTWINGTTAGTTTTCGTSSSGTDRPITNNICATYINGEKKNINKTLKIFLPKEVAYEHKVETETETIGTEDLIKISSIKDNTIFATNKFYNVGSAVGKYVLYYYYAFEQSDSSGKTLANGGTVNNNLDPNNPYYIVLVVDASGNYTFKIVDIFGNGFTTAQVTVNDVSKTNIIVDYTNAVDLTLMKATGAYESNNWRQGWIFEIDSNYVIEFTKIAEDKIQVVVYIFQKILIEEGVYAKNGTEGCDTDTNIEDIAKQPLGHSSTGDEDTNVFTDAGIKIWRVDMSKTDEATDAQAVECNATEVSNGYCGYTNIAYASDSNISSAVKNKVTFDVQSNGRYRIKITDNYENTTETMTGDAKNPKVEVSVIDRTIPVINSELTNNTNTIYSYNYVIGGGQKEVVKPDNWDVIDEKYWITGDYDAIYYNSKGSKTFDYQDALEIAQIRVVDQVLYYSSNSSMNDFSTYSVNFGYNTSTCLDLTSSPVASPNVAAGTYCDPSNNLKSNRNASGTAYNLHSYIISQNITSFSGGLVTQIGTVAYDSTNTYSSVTGTAPTNYVNGSGTFMGYLKIRFTNAADADICTVSLSNSDADNKNCFNLINQYIDDVENFKMIFTAQDYNADDSKRHTSSEVTVNVNVVDNTAPGITNNPIEYTNENSICRLEIDNIIQLKANLLECYKMKDGTTYHIKDNNINHSSSAANALANGEQYYNVADTEDAYYHKKIVLSIEEENEWKVIEDNAATNPHLYKSGYHRVRMEISDHWKDVDSVITGSAIVDSNYNYYNKLTVYLTYYVNPRTLLIEPLANEKMYGENEPTFDYCVYVNKDNSTFNLEGHFFEKEFINEYFVYIYCTKDVYEKIDTTKTYTRTQVTNGKPYTYHEYNLSPTGDYLLINNTFVKIEDSKKYKMEYTQNNNGEFYSEDGSNFYEIKSGYLYNSDSCLYAAMGTEANVYLKFNGSQCKKLENSKRYTKTYTQANDGTYLKYNLNNASSTGNANEALVNNNIFAGNLARVESSCYNKFKATNNYHSNFEATGFSGYLECNENTSITVRNDNVGQYHMVLGTLSIKEDASSHYNEDYVIKINTNYVAPAFQLGGTQTITKDVSGTLVDDGLLTESTVNFTIRQAVLTITANGSSKYFGQQDPYSNNWDAKTQGVNISSTSGYLGGYSVHGWRKNGEKEDGDSSAIILGVLRREIGEEVGIYDICNRSGNPSDTSKLGSVCTFGLPSQYSTSSVYFFAAFDKYAEDGSSTDAALVIDINANIYGNSEGRTLNTGTRNYAILYIKADFNINATDLFIQPGINQGKEYAATEYNDPLWQLVVYGETITRKEETAGVVTWVPNITTNASSFSGYTAAIAVEENKRESVRGVSPYVYPTASNTPESEVYYARRKSAPDVEYKYITYVDTNGMPTYAKTTAGNFYFASSSAGSGTDGKLYIYAYGQYHEKNAVNMDGTELKIEVVGRLVNQTYTLFGENKADNENFALARDAGLNVNWYSYKTIYNYTGTDTKTYTIRKVANNNRECAIATDSISLVASGTGVDCRNYNVVYTKDAPASVKNASNVITGYVTDVRKGDLYMPDGSNECNDLEFYSYSCGEGVKEIKFEIFKREIILEFIDDNYTFVYGERYDYYDGGVMTNPGSASASYSYNTNSNGIFNINNTASEGLLFVCYSDLGDYLVDCTNNPDYGITSGATWTSIGLKFYLHDIVSNSAIYYSTSDANSHAIPAGTYYVYAAIGQLTGSDAAAKNAEVQQNYKFTYRGGTLTIKPKVTSIQLTSYTMEYGEENYDSYGVGSDYSNYTSYLLDKCMTDASYLVDVSVAANNVLITDCASKVDNEIGNKYGFIVEGLDRKDTIAKNFNGRPYRESRDAANVGKFDDVGIYKIKADKIFTINNPDVKLEQFKECTTNLKDGVVVFSGVDATNSCVLVGSGGNSGTVTGNNGINYDITYSKDHNEGANLFILPATIDITIYENQTKMYGCAYSTYITNPNYYYEYTYEEGYANCDGSTDWKVDLAYKYKVIGDKDNNKEYDVSTDTSGNRKFYDVGTTTEITGISAILNDERLYRVTYSSTVNYTEIKSNYSNYQGQKVGTYTISLGKVDVLENSNRTSTTGMCDVYNNPVLVGGVAPCRNYNINYYGNSATTDINEHTYNDAKTVDLNKLKLYELNYTEVSSVAEANYVLINDRFVSLKDLTRYNSDKTTVNPAGEYVLINKFVKVSDLAKYKQQAIYQKSNSCGSNCYIYLDGEYKLLSDVSSLRYADSEGSSQNPNGAYLKVVTGTKTRYVAVDSIQKYAKNTEAYVSDTAGSYVYINDSYVQLSSLKQYEIDGAYYVQVYEFAKLADLSKYKLVADTASNMFKEVSSGSTNNNLYVFVNGSYIPYNSLITTTGQTTIDVSSANTSSTITYNATNDVKFTITARIVYVHPEYNVKPYGDADPVEYITCAEIKTANGLTDFTGRNGYYCGTDTTNNNKNNATKIDLGVTMYYAVANSLAKAPWTAWTDKDQAKKTFNDIQFDVLTGEVSRQFDSSSVNLDSKNDKAGKYTFDFADVVTNDYLNGKNYMIQYVTNKSLESTYVKTSASSFATISSLIYEECDYGSDYCVADTATKGKRIKNNVYKLDVDASGFVITSGSGTPASISLIQKYSSNSSDSAINYWYLGFYKDDNSEGRNGEITRWWNKNDASRPFTAPYDEFKNNSNNNAKNNQGKFFTSDAKEVYFEIIKRTIYLYAVDVEKTYGDADKYSDFLVAICGNDEGYVKDGSGNIKCKSESAADAYGLSDYDKSKFVDSGIMKQWQIKNGGTIPTNGYMFQGTTSLTDSFGIYFRRQNGENAGIYTITACAAQTGVSDCTHKIKEDNPNYRVNVLGDNYKIIEIPGVMVINTRNISITPDTNQGFVYGNYTENGSMPNITFTESHGGENGLVYGSGTYLFDADNNQKAQITKVEVSGKKTSIYEFTLNSVVYNIDGLKVINTSTNEIVATITVSLDNTRNKKTIKIGEATYTIVQKATCLINISGIYTICINDGQNETLANSLGAAYFEYGAPYESTVLTTIVYDGSKGVLDGNGNVVITGKAVVDAEKQYYSYNVYNDSYSNPINMYTRTEAASRNALNLSCGGTDGLRYSRDVCDYIITDGELTVGTSLIPSSTTFYLYITTSRLYTDNSGNKVPVAAGVTWDGKWDASKWASTYVRYGDNKYAPITEANLVSYTCDDDGLNCKYEKNTGANATNNYLKVEVNSNNYYIESVDESVTFSVTSATLTVTPITKQYKIYGEADIEIKFTVVTEYVVGRTHYQNFANSNIYEICNGATCVNGTGLNAYRYGSRGATTSSGTGTYILLPKGWTVRLNSFAYDEEKDTDKANNLDYGVNYADVKYTKSEKELSQSFSSLQHYDKYTSYVSDAKDTSRILLGNLYVVDHTQIAGEHDIVSGMSVATNNLNLGAKNYSLVFTGSIKFVIVPRPVNVQIENINKVYGQATDSESCDGNYSQECVVGDGILIKDDSNNNNALDPNEDENKDLLINNYTILNKELSSAIADSSYNAAGALIKSLITSTYGTGNEVQVTYMTNSTDYSKMNMPTVTSSALDSSDTYFNYVTVNTSGNDIYYTESGSQERKNDTLNIKVSRGNYNIARKTSTCLVSGETNCEDVGEYYLKFEVRSTADTKATAVANAYYDKYWGYNNNYYVIIYNNFENSSWSEFETKSVADGGQGYQSITENKDLYYTKVINEEGDLSYSGTYAANTAPTSSATLQIRKRSIQIVVETVSEYTYTQDNLGTHLRIGAGTAAEPYKYYLIDDNSRYNKVGEKFVHNKDGEYLCSYATKNTTSNCYQIIAANRYNLKSSKVGEKYSIEQSMNVPTLVEVNNTKTAHHTTYNTTDYKNITWYSHPLQVRTKDTLVGEVAYCETKYSLGESGLDGLRHNICAAGQKLHYYNAGINTEGNANFFDTTENGYYIITRETNKLYISYDNAALNSGAYEANNYTTDFVNGILQIDLDETAPVINVETDFITMEANGGIMSASGNGSALSFLEGAEFTENRCKDLVATRTEDGSGNSVASNCMSGTIFTYTIDSKGNDNTSKQTVAGTPSVSYNNIMTLLRWFGISSFDPGVIRAGNPVTKYYHERLYIAIQDDFDQKKVGDYSIFIYAQDDVGNISLATMVTLRIVDTTAPTVGTLNLYNAKVVCKDGSDCSKEENWEVAKDVYLPINTLSSDNLTHISSSDKATKYSFVNKTKDAASGEYIYNFTANNYFGTYYKISAGTDARAVKHDGWTNTSTGIYLTITGGDDNSLTYLDISKYQKYTVEGTTVKNSTDALGTHILLGSFVNVGNITKYREVKANASGNEVTGGSNTNYIPDKAGTIIRYKGYYYDYGSGAYVGGTQPNTALANVDEYTVKLYSYKDGVYTKVDKIPSVIPTGTTYFLMDGELYELPNERYNDSHQHSASGTYINFAQWDHYYSRDGGKSWVKYSRDHIGYVAGSSDNYLALGQDGQRLIMIKAIDNGYTYTGTTVDKNHVLDAYCFAVGSGTCQTWNNVAIGSVTIKDGDGSAINYKEYVGARVWRYNISEWETYSAGGNRDRKYAYLDTIIPNTTLADQHIEIYEYGCASLDKCSTNHTELFGTAIDGYLFKLANLSKYNSSGAADLNGNYVRISGQLIEITNDRLFNVSGGVMTQSNTGEYIYLGKKDDVVSAGLMSQNINGNEGLIAGLTGNVLEIFDKNINAKVSVTMATSTQSSETLDNLKVNTKFIESGVGQSLFEGVGNAEKTFGAKIDGNTVSAADIADKYLTLFVYAEVKNGTGAVVNNPYMTNQGYYKYLIQYNDVKTKYEILACSSSTIFKEELWCTPTAIGEFATMKEAMESLLSVYARTSEADSTNKYNFNGNEITFTLDYRVFDVAGNASFYQRKGVLLTGFTSTITAAAGGAAAASLSVEVEQNTNVMSVLNDFNIVTTSGNSLRNTERIVQSVYYNGMLISTRSAYDVNTLSTLDTTVPGSYRIVYTIERRDGAVYVEGNSVELNVTVKPNVANVAKGHFNYSSLIVMSSVIVSLAVAVIFLKKKKII